MGLDAPAVIETTVVEPAPVTDLAATVTALVAGTAGLTARKRQPKRTPKIAAAPRTNKGTAARSTVRTISNQHPRFDRRALLESDRVA